MPKYNKKVIPNLQRYFNNFFNEASEQEEQVLQSMLGIMSVTSLQHHSLLSKSHFYCRCVAWVKTGDGKNHLVTASSVHRDGKISHAEEQMATAIYHLYKDDPKVVSFNKEKNKFKINIHKMYIDIEPCDGVRYGENHHCRRFFDGKGRLIELPNKNKIRASIDCETATYWNAPLPAEELGTNIRSHEIERDQALLGVDIKDAFKSIHLWDRCFVVTDNPYEPESVMLQQIFAAQIKANESSPEIEEQSKFLLTLESDNIYSSLSSSSKSFLKKLQNNNNKDILHKYAKALAEKWSLRQILANTEISLADARAIREIQYYQAEVKSQLHSSVNDNTLAKESNDIENEESSEEINNHQSDVKENEITSIQKADKGDKRENDNSDQDRIISQFHNILRYSKPAKVASYIQRLDPLLLNTKNMLGFSPLANILNKGHSQTLVIYLNAIKVANEQGILSNEDYSKIFVDNVKDDINPLQYALTSSDPEKLLIYFVELQNNFKSNKLSKSLLRKLLVNVSKDGFTALLLALKAGNTANAALYFTVLQQAYRDGVIDNNGYAQLLIGTNSAGFTPLHQALKAGNAANAALYFKALQQSFRDGVIDKNSYTKVLLGANNAGFTPLHEALISGNAANTALYFKALQQAYGNGVINREEYSRLLIGANEVGFTPLHQALKAGNVENAALYFNALQQAYRNKVINREEYSQLLIGANEAGFTPLHSALEAGNTENAALYFKALKQAYHDSIITKKEYSRLLIGGTQAGFTPLHSALKAGNAQNATLYFKALQQAYRDGVITKKEYAHLLIGANQAGFTPLHSALIAGNAQNAALYFKALQQAYIDDVIDKFSYAKILVDPNKAGFTPLHSALEAGNTENAELYFIALQDAYRNGVISKEEYAHLLISPNEKGFTPLHEALIASNAANTALYFKALQHAYIDGVIDKFSYAKILLDPNKAGFTPLHEALKAGNEKNTMIYYDSLTNALKDGIFDKNEFKKLFIVNNAGYTPLHNAAMNGDLEALKSFIEFIKTNIPEEANKIILDMLETKNKFGIYPCCHKKYHSASKINAYLTNLKYNIKRDMEKSRTSNCNNNDNANAKHFNSNLRSSSQSKRKKDYSNDANKDIKRIKVDTKNPLENNNGSFFTKSDRRSNDTQYAALQRVDSSMAQRCQTLFGNTMATYQIEHLQQQEQTNKIDENQLNHYGSFIHSARFYSAPKEKVQNISAVTSWESFSAHYQAQKQIMLSLPNTNVDCTFKYCDQKHECFNTYGGTIKDQQTKIYVIELKQPKANKIYDFTKFKPEKTGAIFVINFACPAGSTLILPPHMQCYVMPQNQVTIYNAHHMLDIKNNDNNMERRHA